MTLNKRIFYLILIGVGIFFMARLGLYITYYDIFAQYSFSQIFMSFLRGLRFDLSIFLTVTSIFWILLLIPLGSIVYQKIVLWSMFIVYLSVGVFLAVDVNYYGYVGRHFANEPFLMTNDLGFAVDMLRSYWLQLLILAVFVVILGFLWRKFTNKPLAKVKSWKKQAIFSILWLGVIFLFIRGGVGLKPISTIDAFAEGDINLGNLTLNGAFTSARFLSQKLFTNNEAYDFFDDKTAEEIFKSGKADNSCPLPQELNLTEKPNVVVVMLESWSAYYTDFFGGNGFGVTPNLDKLASEGIAFMRHYSPERRSISAIQAALTGIPPISGLPSLGFGLETMASGNVGRTFADKGYDTIFIQSSKRRSFYMDGIAKSLGFKSYYGMEDVKVILDYPDKTASVFGWDYETYLLYADKLKESRKPFLSFLFTGTTHVPYAKLPEKFMKFPHDADKEEGFLNTLYYADWSLGEFFKQIENEAWFKDTIFIITADHNLGRFEKVDYPETFRVPLVIWSPSMKNGIKVDNITSHIDITPTLLHLAGAGGKAMDYLGDSVFCKNDASYAVLSEWNVAGFVGKDMFLRHSFGDVLSYEPAGLSKESLDNASQKLLAYYQVAFKRVIGGKGK